MSTSVPVGRRSRWSRGPARLAALSLTAATVLLLAPARADAHVTVTPSAVEGGGFAVVTFRVPTERDDASTTAVRVTLPEDQPIGSVRTTPVPGWRVAVDTRTLDEPIEMFGQEVDEVVSRITWRATGSGIGPGQFEDFDVSLGPLPESGEMVFQALQTYSSGERVSWNQVAVDDSVEPEHPAPLLRLTAPADDAPADGSAAEGDDPDPATEDTTEDSTQDTTDTSSTMAMAMSGGALLLSLVAVVLARRRPRT